MPLNLLLPNAGATEPSLLQATHTLLPLSGMYRGDTGQLRFRNDEKLICLARFIAAERPPHLRAIAPWEGLADYYREMLGRGGIPNPAFVDYRGSGYCGATASYLWPACQEPC